MQLYMNTLTIRLTSAACILVTCGVVHADVTYSVDFGQLTNSESTPLPAGALWALIGQDSLGSLPGGLSANDGLSSDPNLSLISAEFAGSIIETGEIIGGGRVLATGPIDGDGFVSDTASSIDFEGLGLNVNDRFGFYWFPDLTEISNVLPQDSPFEIGGFQQDSVSEDSGGNIGMQVPASGNYALAYYDSSVTGGATPYDPILFRSVVIPETSSVLLAFAGCLLMMRRRR